jgi:Uma2 family endonuclease
LSCPDRLAAEAFIMVVAHQISEQEYRELALNDPDRSWELWDGVPREKPLMSMKHEDVSFLLGYMLQGQLDWRMHRVNVNGCRLRVSPVNYFIPDVAVIPAAYKVPFEDDPRALNAFADPLPLVIEVWSRTTGAYDFATKLRAYRARGDVEIWFIHPYECTLTTWHRQPDGGYVEETYRGGPVPVASLPGVSIDLDALLGPSSESSVVSRE